MISKEQESDPCPNIPETFIDPQRIRTLSREIKGFAGEMDSSEESEEESDTPLDEREGRPEVLVRSVVATRQGTKAFGRQVAAEAYSRGFAAARRKACVCDGSSTNWGVHRKHFSHYTPILDFVHAICYVYAAALAGRGELEAWKEYGQWAQWLWSGETDQLIAAVASRSEELGQPKSDDDTSPAAIVAKTLTYLKNQRSRMKYNEYRRLGLPITSCHVESTIKQINKRMKGSEKFWHQGAEPMLRLVADDVSETTAYDQFWRNRAQNLSSTRRYQTAA